MSVKLKMYLYDRIFHAETIKYIIKWFNTTRFPIHACRISVF